MGALQGTPGEAAVGERGTAAKRRGTKRTRTARREPEGGSPPRSDGRTRQGRMPGTNSLRPASGPVYSDRRLSGACRSFFHADLQPILSVFVLKASDALLTKTEFRGFCFSYSFLMVLSMEIIFRLI